MIINFNKFKDHELIRYYYGKNKKEIEFISGEKFKRLVKITKKEICPKCVILFCCTSWCNNFSKRFESSFGNVNIGGVYV